MEAEQYLVQIGVLPIFRVMACSHEHCIRKVVDTRCLRASQEDWEVLTEKVHGGERCYWKLC